MPGRAIEIAKVKSAKKGFWLLLIADRADPLAQPSHKLFPGKTFTVPVREIDLVPNDRATARRVASEIARILSCWPFPVFDRNGMSNKLVLDLALGAVCGTVPQTIHSPNAHKIIGYTISIYHFDPTTGDSLLSKSNIAPTDTNIKGMTVPPLPPHVREIKTFDRVETFNDRDKDGNLPYYPWVTELNVTSSAQSQQTAQDFLLYLAVQCNGLVATKAQMAERLFFWSSMCNYRSIVHTKPYGIYGNHPLYNVRQDLRVRQIVIMPSTAVRRDMELQKQTGIYIESLTSTRVTPVLDTLISGYLGNPDVRYALIEAAKIADLVNLDIAEGNAPVVECNCDDYTTGLELHSCHACLKPTLCKTRSFDRAGRLVCPDCIVRETTRATPQPSNRTLAQSVVAHKSFRLSFIDECRSRGIDPRSSGNRAVSEAAIQVLYQKLPPTGNQYYDEYLDQTTTIAVEIPNPSLNPSRRRMHPHTPTVDAAFPRALSKDGRYFTHTAANVRITSLPPQFVKHVYLPGYIAELSNYLRIENPSPTPQQVENFYSTVDRLTQVRQNVPHSMAARMKGKPQAQRDKRNLEEGVSGTPVGGKFTIPKYRACVDRGFPPASRQLFDEEARSRTSNLAAQIAQQFKRSLTYAADGVPWFSQAYAMPQDWCWNACAVFCKQRLTRMRLQCNRIGITRDTEESILAELVWQACTDDPS